MRIKVNELRIGNLVLDRGKSVQLKPSQMVNIIMGKYSDYYEFIPLTEDWLVKLGFEEETGVFTKRMSDEIIAVGSDGSFGFYNSKFDFDRGDSFSNNNRVKYVHQLQNLYFALTNQELKFLKP